MFAEPAVDLTRAYGSRGHYGKFHSRVRELPEFSNELPVAALAEEITTPGAGQVRALFTFAGNPVLSTPNGGQLDAALEQLEFMVSIDLYLNESSRHAHLILPPTSPLERSHYDIALSGFAVRNVAKYSPPLFAKPAGALHDHEILGADCAARAQAAGFPVGARVAASEGRVVAAPRTRRHARLDAQDGALRRAVCRENEAARRAAGLRRLAPADAGARSPSSGPDRATPARRAERRRPRSARAGVSASDRDAQPTHRPGAGDVRGRSRPRRGGARRTRAVAVIDRPAPRAQQQLLAAQQPAPGEGQAALHAACCTRTTRPRAAWPTARSRASRRAWARSRWPWRSRRTSSRAW